MPRPGPRPYECVKRAWHSERHQPMRGLIIQHIFRLVRDNHRDATKQNREWQEKLPIVVLKAEEIMYSKANSEAEYSNLDTVWHRVNEAVDTIIRRDESTESGDLLPPCVEAALNLGCVPVKATRSQRLNNPRTYLRPQHQESRDISPKGLILNENSNDGQKPPFVHLSTSSNSPTTNVGQNLDSPRLFWESNNSISKSNTNNHVAASSGIFPPHIYGKNNIEVEGISSHSSRGSVYPLCYGKSFGLEATKSDPIIVGMPVFKSVPEPAKLGGLRNLFPVGEPTQEFCEAADKGNRGKGTETTCDLSLRLGVATDYSNSSREKDSDGDISVNATGLRCYQEKRRPQEVFSFFPVESDAHGHSRLQKSRLETDSENQISELVVPRKRKRPDNNVVIESDDHLIWSHDPISNHQSRRSES